MDVRSILKKMPVAVNLLRKIARRVSGGRAQTEFPGSIDYWEQRYEMGGKSGVGSTGQFAQFKADVINKFVRKHGVCSVIEFGCGDGDQLALADYPEYLGCDISRTAINACRARFSEDTTKSFILLQEYSGQRADLTLSLDVIYHLVEEEQFSAHMERLFSASKRFVIIYASNSDDNSRNSSLHVHHRQFSRWIEENRSGSALIEHIVNPFQYRGDHRTGSFADFYIYELPAVPSGSQTSALSDA